MIALGDWRRKEKGAGVIDTADRIWEETGTEEVHMKNE
jgi:hypothetical protein